MQFQTKFKLGDRVNVDDDKSIKATIVAFLFKMSSCPAAEVQWFLNGEAKGCWFDESRLSLAEGEKNGG